MEIPPDLELAIASKLDAERQLKLARKYLKSANSAVLREAVRQGVTGVDLMFMINQMSGNPSAKQVHNLKSE